MRRLPLTIALLTLLLAGLSTTASASPKPRLAAHLTTCTAGATAGDRAAVFTGSMPSLRATRTMQMRFVLLQRRGTGAFRAVDVPDWGTWEHSAPGHRGFVFSERIESLLAPAGYRAVVYFRWLDRRGHVQRTARRTSRTCEQPDPRAQLAFDGLSAATVQGGAVYTVAVRNDGMAGAPPFTVTLSFDGGVQGTATLGPLGPGGRGEAALRAPRCAAGADVTVTVDAGHAVDESDETDDIVTRPCPLGAAG